MTLRTFAYLLITQLALCCTVRPLQLSDFRELDIKDGWNRSVELSLDMEDTVNTGMIEICMQIRNSESLNNIDHIPVIVGIVSPQGIQYRESIALPVTVTTASSAITFTNGIRNYRWPYRRGIENRIAGRWIFTLTPALPDSGPYGEIYKEIIGVGISCKKDNL